MLTFIREKLIKKLLSQLVKLNESFFDGYVKQDSLVKQYKTLYSKHMKFIKTLHGARKIAGHELAKIENLHDIICSLHLLRFHFNEFALFEVCFQEMQVLKKTSTQLLYDRNTHLANEFMNAIHAFETLYHNTLQVVARDPRVFQFFIQDLYALHDAIMSDS